MKHKVLWLAAGVVIGIVFAQQIKGLPFVSKIPTI